MSLIAVYCQISDYTVHPVIVSCFEDLSENTVDRLLKVRQTLIPRSSVDNAIPSVCQLRCGQEEAVGHLISTSLTCLNRADHCVRLLQLVLRKSCPKSKTLSSAGWMDWFCHLLSWPLWTCFLRLTGNRTELKSMFFGGLME